MIVTSPNSVSVVLLKKVTATVSHYNLQVCCTVLRGTERHRVSSTIHERFNSLKAQY